MATFLHLCYLVLFLAVCGTRAVNVRYSGNDTPNTEEGRYLQLLSRVEILEKRDMEQQAEINILKTELFSEKQKTSKLEGMIVTLKKSDRKGNTDDEGTNADETQTDVQDSEKSIGKAQSEKKSGDQPTKIRRQEGMPVVAFHTTLSSHLQHAGVHQSIAFNNVITNIGGAYNPHVGTFVAPVAGVYVFSTTLLTPGDHDFHSGIMKNGNAVAYLYVRGAESNGGNGSAMVVVHLNKGDDVTVQIVDPDRFVYGYHYSMFSGFLLHGDHPSESIIGKK